MRVLGFLTAEPVQTKWAAPDFIYHYEFVSEDSYNDHTPFDIYWNNAKKLGILTNYPESKCKSSAVSCLIAFILTNADKYGQLLIQF